MYTEIRRDGGKRLPVTHQPENNVGITVWTDSGRITHSRITLLVEEVEPGMLHFRMEAYDPVRQEVDILAVGTCPALPVRTAPEPARTQHGAPVDANSPHRWTVDPFTHVCAVCHVTDPDADIHDPTEHPELMTDHRLRPVSETIPPSGPRIVFCGDCPEDRRLSPRYHPRVLPRKE